MCYKLIFIGFFFQAEDGIRDGRVTGVQTCALPISTAASSSRAARRSRARSTSAASMRSGSAWHERARQDVERRRDQGRLQIGRASCRERVKISVAVVASKIKITYASDFIIVL